MAALESESCQRLATEVSEVLRGADKQWRALEAQLGEAEERAIGEHVEDLEKWFGNDVSESVSNWTEGGLRRKTRDRIQKLLLAPLDERIWHQVSLSEVQLSSAGGDLVHPIDMLLEHWDANIEPILGNAIKEDTKLVKKIRRLNSVGATRDANIADQKRLDIWTSVRSAIVVAEKPSRALAALLSADLGVEVMTRMAAAVPAIVARSVCDWHFQRCCGEFEQLRGWWEGVHEALQSRPAVWERLMEEEGMFVRRINRGIEEIQAERSRYASLANFGHSGVMNGRTCTEWPTEGGALLARVVKEMRRRLFPIRDSAAWRVIDSAKAIQKDITAKEKAKERSPWEQVGQHEGIEALCRGLGIAELRPSDLQEASKGIAALSHLEPDDAALCFAGTLDRLVVIVTDLGKLAADEDTPDTGGLFYILEEVLQSISYVQEELLEVLDDASTDSLAKWLRHSWGEWGDALAGSRLEAAMSAMPLKADSVLRLEKRQVRRSQLALMRGLQSLLADSHFRARLLDLAAAPLRVASSAKPNVVQPPTPTHCTAGDALEFSDLKPSAEISLSASPRSVYVCRKPEKLGNDEEAAPSPASKLQGPSVPVELVPSAPKYIVQEFVSTAGQCHPETPLSTKRVTTPQGPRKSLQSEEADALDSTSDSALQNLPSARAKAPEITQAAAAPVPAGIQTRPVTPSWLDPPWPRQDMPFQSWTPRPGTSSTVCDEADLAQPSKSKFIDGQLIPVRPSVSGLRLAPLNPAGTNGYPAKSAGNRRAF